MQSSFDAPCVPFEESTPGSKGFFSGFKPVGPDSTTMPTFTIMVKDTKPMWFYCSQAKHCQGGMVGVVNAPAANASRTLETFKEGAKKAEKNVTPTQICDTSSAAPSSAAPSSAVETSLSTSVSPSGANATDISTVSPIAAPTDATTFSTSLSTPTLLSQSNTTTTGGPLQVTTSAGRQLQRNGQLAGAGLMVVVLAFML